MMFKRFFNSGVSYLGLAAVLLVTCKQIPKEERRNVSSRIEGKRAVVHTTADSTTFRMAIIDTLEFRQYPQPVETETTIFVDPLITFQTFLGIGGALTDASAETFARLSPEKQEELLDAYYNPETGIGYSLARTHINSCDFSSDSYTYVQDNDEELASFDISHDKNYRIPFIKRAIEAAGGNLTLYVSPWSPPAWMKNNNSMLFGGKLKPEYRQNWADYYVKFIKAYEAEGIPVWGLTVQNEPMAKQTWESCIFTAEEERDFIKDHLGPTLERQGLGSKKIIAWDHNRDLIYQRSKVLFDDPEAVKYIWGIGFHWYEDWSGGQQMYDNVSLVNETWRNTNLLFTEGCNSPFAEDKINDWRLGERYASSMIHDFNAGTVGWTDWNILLDEKGGPNHVGNYCFAPIHADSETGKLIYTNAYYYIGHFSKFIVPGATRIQSSASRSSLLSTSFKNPDDSIVTIVMNSTENKIQYLLWIENSVAEGIALPHSISTLIIK